MTDLLFQMGLSNACLSLALAIVAMAVGAKARRPHLAHMLWLLVFVKLVTPPIVTIPIVTIPSQGETAVVIDDDSSPGLLISESPELKIEASSLSKLGSAAWNHARVWLPPVWLLGSVVVFAWSMIRVFRFSRLLVKKSEVAPHELQAAAVEMARRLELKRICVICTTSARISPMVWWTGGRVRIVIPTTLLDQMDDHESQWILAHELAHVRRRDYLVRWLEWLACVCFWWNPVVWWAQRNLRAAEEVCCDELVISSLNPKPKSYANSLLSAVEFLARPAFRPPAMASEINSGGYLERRFKMIVSETSRRSTSRWLQICVLLCAVVVLPLGIASAADYEAVGRRLRAAVAAGELTGEEARIMMDALRRPTNQVERGDRRISREDYERSVAELKKAVAEGEISEEDARIRLNEMRKAMAGQVERGERRVSRDEYAHAEAEIKKLIAEGKISKEDAKARLNGMRRMMAAHSERGERRITVEEYKRAEAKMRKMIADGKAKPEDVERRLIEMRKMIAAKREGAAGKVADWEGIKERIEGAVKSGKMTRKEADAKYKEIKKQMSQRSEGAVKKVDVKKASPKKAAPKKVDVKKAATRKISREDLVKAAGEIRKAIAEGKITEEQGRAKLAKMRNMIADKSKGAARKGVDSEGIKERIESAVKSGKITREQADAKYKAIREKMGRKIKEKNAKDKDS